jgi:hypothetical protein
MIIALQQHAQQTLLIVTMLMQLDALTQVRGVIIGSHVEA